MRKLILKIIPAIFFGGIFTFVILQVPYPQSLTQASFAQILSFFIPLFLAFVFTFNIFLKNILLSASIALGIIFILILQALDSLNLVTGILILIATGLLVSYFRKTKHKPWDYPAKRDSLSKKVYFPSEKKRLTNYLKIPKLKHMRKRINE